MKRKPGRPRVDPRQMSIQVCLSMPANRYDELWRRAQRERVSVPEVIRRRLTDSHIQTSD